ncbi:MAG: guanine deaminase [Rhodospirillales bacterium 20-60-12]|nr:MAG: guanine deaminase [Rhodospirillales bacterium 20-60-12]HQT66156.1 guanine deaminase [Acetobacteraceae bacterium]HQU01360.1 guanine deaminase [Acetobacteraceae bacterium]
MNLHNKAVRGNLIHAPVCGQIEALLDALILIDEAGVIAEVLPGCPPRLCADYAARGALVTLRPGQYLLPGLVDLHVHAPQFPQLGKALDLPLDRWLMEHTFPLEARYEDVGFAAEIYGRLIDTLLANGTTTALYFATIHLPASLKLAELCLQRGQRALVGRVAMDHPQTCPAFYRDASAALAADETRDFIAQVQALPGNVPRLVWPVITPRFIPACTDELLQLLGALATQTGCHVQTHCSEGDWEHQHVLARTGQSDAAALADFGLLTRRTVLAHGNFVSAADMDLIGAAGAGIAHCPVSNSYLADAVFPLRAALDRGLHVGLGTDIAGGASPSVLENARHAVTVSRMREDGVDATKPAGSRGVPGARIDFREAFWLATAGGGAALDLPIGQFAPGYMFDAMLVDQNAPHSHLGVTADDDAADVLQKIIYLVQRTNIARVWVGGRMVHEI